MAKVSVLVPVYNVENYLAECLDSIISQTLEDIEIICVNDGSTDSSLEILEQYTAKDSRIKIIDKENGGLPSARNAGLDNATGEYVSFVDSDDHIQPNMMSVLYNNAKSTNAEIVICGANVFPEKPHADEWVYTVLSPGKKFYPKCSDELLYKDPASRPFIWRTFVKRDLIERNHIRLNEQIQIGEDNALQFRLYPLANGISLIPDKLYNYRWFRKDSLMNTIVYKDTNKKALSHIKMVLHIAEEWEKNGETESSAFSFLKWSVEFLYDDFIRLPLKFRVSESKTLTEMWTKYGFYQFRSEFPDYISDMFDYFCFMSEQEDIEQNISIVMSADRDYLTLEKSLKSCLSQSYKSFELVLINNCVSDKQYPILQKYLFKDKRIRLINHKKTHFTEAYNKSVELCIGKYIHFILPSFWYRDENSLEEWANAAIKNNVDILISPARFSESSVFNNIGNEIMLCENSDDYFVDASVHASLIKREYIMENEFGFKNYSIESGSVFMARLCLNSDETYFVNKTFCVCERQYEKDWIPTEECVAVLRSFADRLKLSVEYNSIALHKKVFSLLSSDYYFNILVNNTLPYWMPDWECPDGSNSQYEVIEQLMEVLSLLSPEMLGDDTVFLPYLFQSIVDRRHKFISDLSGQYCAK